MLPRQNVAAPAGTAVPWPSHKGNRAAFSRIIRLAMARLLIGFVLALWVAAVGAQQSQPDGKALFAATLSDLAGRPVALASLRGRPLVINFWARWCDPCRKEIPELAKRAAQARGRGLQVIGIAIEDDAEAVRSFARTYGMDYRILLAKDQGIGLLQASGDPGGGLPYTLAVNRRGRVTFSQVGALAPAEMDAAFAAALKP